MDRVTRCLHCGKRMVPTPSYTGSTELKCVFCDKLDRSRWRSRIGGLMALWPLLFPGQSLKRTCPQKPLGGDVAVFDVRHEGWLNPGGLGFPDRFGEFGFRADDRIQLLADLTGDGSGPACPDLAHVDQVLSFLLPEVERGDAAGIFDKPNHREFALLHAFDFEPVLSAL